MKNYLITALVTFCAVVLGMWVASLVSGHGPALGATPQPGTQDSPYTNTDGMQEYSVTVPFTATSSFVYSLKNPFNATSSIEVVSVNSQTNGFTAANNLYVSTGTTAFGTSTPALAIFNIPASGAAFSYSMVKNMATSTAAVAGVTYITGSTDILPGMSWSGANGIIGSNYILGPTQYLNIKVATTTAGVFGTYLTGTGVTVKIRKL